ncbi:uncharacterized protein [Asterias amurensis]|uniref:uncharacterized protein n=1 Tax=Asterias amurensis TaxID=7602 RepID=UPI003AB4714A
MEKSEEGKSSAKTRQKSKGKAPLPKHKDPAFKRRQAQAKEQELRHAVYESAKDAGVRMGQEYRALVCSSDSEEEEFVNRAVGEMMDYYASEGPESTAENSGDESSDSSGSSDEDYEVEEGWAAGEDDWWGDEEEWQDKKDVDDGDDFNYDDDFDRGDEATDIGEDGESDDDISGPSRQKKIKLSSLPSRQTTKQKHLNPESDNDPDPPSADQPDFPPDQFGWTRSLEDIKVTPFRPKKPLGPKFARSNSTLKYFFHFFPRSLLLDIAKWTNVKLREAGEKPTTIQEIQAWLGVIVLMGLFKQTIYRNYWSTDPILRNNLIAHTMSRNRFDALNNHLTCNDPDIDPAHFHDPAHRVRYKMKHPVYPLEPMWEKVRRRCLRRYNANRELTIDDATIKFAIPPAPVLSFTIHVLAEASTGAVLNFIAYPWEVKSTKMTTIATKVANHHLGRYHHIFTDTLYTSVALARNLLTKNTYLTGALKTDSKELPTELSYSDKNPNKRMENMTRVPRGTFYSRQNGQMVVTAWKDSDVMLSLSTAHQGWRDPTVHNLTRKKKDNPNGRRVTRVIPAPPQVCEYTKFMVQNEDRSDHMRAYYTCYRQGQYWWKRILYFLVDTARVNGFNAYKQLHYNDTPSDDNDISAALTHSQFVLSLGTALIDGYRAKFSNPQNKSAKAGSQRNIPGHRSSTMPGLYPKRCKWCLKHKGLTASGLIRTTKYGCQVCMVNLCPGACFIKFHTPATTMAKSEHLSEHISSKMPGYYAKGCRWCRQHNGVTASGRTQVTKYGCKVCMVNLCPGACFTKFHEDAQKQIDTTPTAETSALSPERPNQEQEMKKERREKDNLGEEVEGREEAQEGGGEDADGKRKEEDPGDVAKDGVRVKIEREDPGT